MKAWRRGRHGLSDKEAVQGFISANTCAFFYMGYLCLFRSAGKESPCNAGDPRLIRGLGRSPGEGIGYPCQYSWASLVAQSVKNQTAVQETWVWSLSWEDPLEEGMATHSIILAWRIPKERGAWQAAVHRVTKNWT